MLSHAQDIPNRRAILAAAWASARALAAASGRQAREHLSEAQRAAWAAARAAAALPARAPVPAPRPAAQIVDVAAIGADDTGEATITACLALGEAIFDAVRRLAPVDRAGARSLGRLGAAVELAALDWRDRAMAMHGKAARHAGSGRVH